MFELIIVYADIATKKLLLIKYTIFISTALNFSPY